MGCPWMLKITMKESWPPTMLIYSSLSSLKSACHSCGLSKRVSPDGADYPPRQKPVIFTHSWGSRNSAVNWQVRVIVHNTYDKICNVGFSKSLRWHLNTHMFDWVDFLSFAVKRIQQTSAELGIMCGRRSSFDFCSKHMKEAAEELLCCSNVRID